MTTRLLLIAAACLLGCADVAVDTTGLGLAESGPITFRSQVYGSAVPGETPQPEVKELGDGDTFSVWGSVALYLSRADGVYHCAFSISGEAYLTTEGVDVHLPDDGQTYNCGGDQGFENGGRVFWMLPDDYPRVALSLRRRSPHLKVSVGSTEVMVLRATSGPVDWPLR